jgi:pimeloyl-[acyl-carrier protein] synthase
MPTSVYDPLHELNSANRERIYAELRERTPVYWSSAHVAWVLTRFTDVNAVLSHPDALALEVMPFLRSLGRRGNLNLSSLLGFCSSLSLLTRPPHHEALRRVLAQALGGIRRLNLPELLERRADWLLDCGEREGFIDLAEGYGRALPLFVISSFLGVPEDDLQKLGELAFDLIAVFEGLPSVRTLNKLNNSAAALMDYFRCLIVSRRQNPGSDGTSLIVQLADQQLRCSDEELAGYCTFFFIAAEETTAAGISGAAWILLQRPAWRTQLTGDRSLIPGAVRELLRLVSPVQYVFRQMRADIRVGGQLIRAGEAAMLMLGAANRDPASFPNPDEPELGRNGPEPVVFAPGPYRCIGAALATFEVETAIRKLLERPRLTLSPQAPVWAERKNIAPIKHLRADFIPQEHDDY